MSRGDVTGPGGGEMAQSLCCQSDGVPAASRRTAGTQTPVVTHPENAEAQRVLDVRYNAYIKECIVSDSTFKETLHLTRIT